MEGKRLLIIPRAKTNRSEAPLKPLTAEQAAALYPTLVEIGKKQAEKLKLLRAAIERKDTPEVYRLAASVCGLGDDYGNAAQESH